MYKVEHPTISGEQRRRPRGHHVIPSDVWHGQVLCKALVHPTDNPQPASSGGFFTRFKQQLHPQTDSKQRTPLPDVTHEQLT